MLIVGDGIQVGLRFQGHQKEIQRPCNILSNLDCSDSSLQFVQKKNVLYCGH
jgi:hypothetical protein